jgi:membrane protease YdiL (CAAX protease family)
MNRTTACISRHPVAAYFALTFAISWGGVLAIGRSDPASGGSWQSDPKLPLLIVAMLAGPSLAGLLLTAIVSGRAGLRDVGSRLVRSGVGARWYAVALLTAPLVFTIVHVALSRVSPVYLPNLPGAGSAASFLMAAIGGALFVGGLEELGWTGFAVPRLRRRHSVLATGLLVGVPWGAWHLLTNDIWIASAFSGDRSPAVFMTATGVSLLAGQLPAYRVLMVWVDDRTGSLLIAVLMHTSLAACTFAFGLSVTGAAFLLYAFGLAVAWWIVVAAVALVQRGHLAHHPLGRAA